MAFDFRLPESMRSVDFTTFEALYKITLGVIKGDIDDISHLQSPDSCPDHMLPLLAGRIGMEYRNDAIPIVNREIIKNWWWAMKHKGTAEALQLMASLALLTYSVSTDSVGVYNRSVDIAIDRTTGERYIRISYQPVDESIATIEEQEKRMTDYIELVRPAGFSIRFTKSEFSHVYINMDAQHAVSVTPEQYTKERFSSINFYTEGTPPTGVTVHNESVKLPGDPNCFGSYSDTKAECAVCSAKTRCQQSRQTGIAFTEVTNNDTEN